MTHLPDHSLYTPFYIVFSFPVMKNLIWQLSLPLDFSFYFLLATSFVMSSHMRYPYCIEQTLYYFIIHGVFRASIPLKKPKHTTHLLRNIYLYLRTNQCSTIDPGPIVKCAVSRVLRLFCHDSLHDYNEFHVIKLATIGLRPFNERDSPCSWNAVYLRLIAIFEK